MIEEAYTKSMSYMPDGADKISEMLMIAFMVVLILILISGNKNPYH